MHRELCKEVCALSFKMIVQWFLCRQIAAALLVIHWISLLQDFIAMKLCSELLVLPYARTEKNIWFATSLPKHSSCEPMLCVLLWVGMRETVYVWYLSSSTLICLHTEKLIISAQANREKWWLALIFQFGNVACSHATELASYPGWFVCI